MFKLVIITSVCVMSLLDISGSANGKPIPELRYPETKLLKISTMKLSPKRLIELVQYAMRTMVSRINVNPQAAVSSKEFLQDADSASVARQSTRQKIIQAKHRQNLGSVNQLGEKSFESSDQKLIGREKLEKFKSTIEVSPTVIVGSEINNFNESSRSAINENATSRIEPLVEYVERNVETVSKQNDFEILAKNLTVTETEAIPENQPLSSAKALISSSEEGDSSPFNIRVRNLTIERISSLEADNGVTYFPFEAIIKLTEQKSSSLSELNDHDVEIIPTRYPPDDFPPYFDTVLSLDKKRANKDSTDGDRVNSNLSGNAAKKFSDDDDGVSQPISERQLPMMAVGEVLEMFDFTKHGIKESWNNNVNNSISRDPKASGKNNADGVLISVKFDKNITDTRSQSGSTSFQRQEIEDYDDGDEEERGSLSLLTDVLPLVLPILEDLSNPNTDTDIAELLETGLPLVQGLSQPNDDNDGIDLVGIVSPIIASLSGPSRRGNGTVLQSIIPLILPLIIPFIGPIVGPIIQGLSTPADQGGSSITPIIQAIAGPLSLPAVPGGISPAASLISGVIASLSKDLKANSGQGGSDIGALVSTLISGVISGGSAGLSAGSTKPVPSVSPPRQSGWGTYGQAPVPASSVNPLDLVTSSVKEIFGFSVQLIRSFVASVTEILGASSAEKPKSIYGSANEKSQINSINSNI